MGKEEKGTPIDSTNIFDEFAVDDKLRAEIQEADKQNDKNGLFYLAKVGSLIQAFNLLFFMWLTLVGGYLYIQFDNELAEAWYLNPVCHYFLWEVWRTQETCSSVSYSLKDYKDKIVKKEKWYFNKIKKQIPHVYALSHHIYSKEVLFLLKKTKYRLRPLQIFQQFDTLKNEFEPLNKGKIMCEDMVIQEWWIVNISCAAYSADWGGKIIWESWNASDINKKEGTSVSVASSFINFLQKKSRYFTVVQKTKKLSFEDILGGQWYTRKTSFTLRLQFNDTDTNISLLQ